MNKIEIYKTPDNQVVLQVNLDNDTVWLTQDQMVLLFGRDQSVVSRHIRNVFKEGELKSSRKQGISSLAVLSHHRTCRSAYGGLLE